MGQVGVGVCVDCQRIDNAFFFFNSNTKDITPIKEEKEKLCLGIGDIYPNTRYN